MNRDDLFKLPEMEGLSPLQQRFAVAYAVDTNFNAAEACRAAGFKTKYPNKYGHELLQKPHVMKAIAAVSVEIADKNTALKPEYALRKLKKALETAEEAGKLNEMIRATELLMKHFGMFVERTEVTGKDGEAIEIKRMQDDLQSFTSSIDRLIRRSGEGDGTSETQH